VKRRGRRKTRHPNPSPRAAPGPSVTPAGRDRRRADRCRGGTELSSPASGRGRARYAAVARGRCGRPRSHPARPGRPRRAPFHPPTEHDGHSYRTRAARAGGAGANSTGRRLSISIPRRAAAYRTRGRIPHSGAERRRGESASTREVSGTSRHSRRLSGHELVRSGTTNIAPGVELFREKNQKKDRPGCFRAGRGMRSAVTRSRRRRRGSRSRCRRPRS
jgi:hypothetical protein